MFCKSGNQRRGRGFGAMNTAPVVDPVPDKATVCGDPVALSAMLTEAVRAPVAVGLKVTEIVQLAAAAMVAVQVVVSLKSAAFVPVMVIATPVSETVPAFLTVTVCAAEDDAIFVVANVSEAGVRVTADAPVPESVTD